MYERLPISGVTETHLSRIPDGYKRLQRRHGVDMHDAEPLAKVIDYLRVNYDIEWRDLYYKRDRRDDESFAATEPVTHYRALINPAWEGVNPEDIPGDREDAVWHIPTKKYTRAPHHEMWEPFEEAIMNRGMETVVFGECRVRREGGEVHLDLFASSKNAHHDGEQLVFGVTTGHDYYGNTRLYLDFIAYHDTGDGVGQVMRYITDPRRRKHTGAAREDVVGWYEESLGQLDDAADTLYGVVATAMAYEIPLGEMACSIEGFYERLGLPNYGESTLAAPAATRAVETAVGPYTAWHLFKAGMWAIEHKYESRDTSSFKKHCEAVNLLLYNPKLAEKRVLESIASDIRRREDSEVWSFVDESEREGTLADVETRITTVSEGAESVTDIRKRLRMLLEDTGVEEKIPDADDGPNEEEADV